MKCSVESVLSHEHTVKVLNAAIAHFPAPLGAFSKGEEWLSNSATNYLDYAPTGNDIEYEGESKPLSEDFRAALHAGVQERSSEDLLMSLAITLGMVFVPSPLGLPARIARSVAAWAFKQGVTKGSDGPETALAEARALGLFHEETTDGKFHTLLLLAVEDMETGEMGAYRVCEVRPEE
jgi:hypothetical protein